MEGPLISRRYMRLRMAAVLALLLFSALVSFQITSMLAHQAIAKAKLTDAIDSAQLAVSTTMLALQALPYEKNRQGILVARSDLASAARQLEDARLRLEQVLTHMPLSPETRRILDDPQLCPLTMMEDTRRIAETLSGDPAFPGSPDRVAAVGLDMMRRITPALRQMYRAEGRANEIAAARLVNGGLAVLGLSVFVLAATALLVLRPLEKRVLAAQAETEERRRIAEQANEAKTRFLATMSHEIRTPMNGVLGMADVLRTTGLNARQTKMLDIIVKSGAALMEIIDSVLDLAKIESGRMTLSNEPFDLRRVCDEVASLFSGAAAAKGVMIELSLDEHLAMSYRGDAGAIRQVLSNLVGNAVKFTEKGSVHLTARPIKKKVEIRVRDTGIGVPLAAQSRIFESFEQVDSGATRRFGGTGLGLAIVRRMTEAMGGGVTLESELGVGSTFILTIPLEAAASGSGSLLTTAAEAEIRQGLRVLVAEDNSVNQIVTGAMLRHAGCIVTFAETGTAVMEMLAEESFDIVFMDISMPGMNGYEATRAIRVAEAQSGGQRLPVIGLSAHALAEQRAEALDAGMDDFITKPVAARTLRAALGRYGRFAAVDTLSQSAAMTGGTP